MHHLLYACFFHSLTKWTAFKKDIITKENTCNLASNSLMNKINFHPKTKRVSISSLRNLNPLIKNSKLDTIKPQNKKPNQKLLLFKLKLKKQKEFSKNNNNWTKSMESNKKSSLSIKLKMIMILFRQDKLSLKTKINSRLKILRMYSKFLIIWKKLNRNSKKVTWPH